MGQQDLYKKVLEKTRKGKGLTAKEKNTVDELTEIDGEIAGFEVELQKMTSHANWLATKIYNLKQRKKDILDSFDDRGGNQKGG